MEAEFFQEVLAASKHLDFDEMIVLLTPNARTQIPKCPPGQPARTESNWKALRRTLRAYPNRAVTGLKIPNGSTVAEIWKIFSRIGDKLEVGDEVYFDITYGFRSLFMLALIAISYLRVTKKVKLRGIFYGAFEAKDTRGVAPVFDLTPFAQLLDLTDATNQFLETGSSKRLVNLLEETIGSSPLLSNIQQISASLDLLRPSELMQSASGLSASVATEKVGALTQFPPVDQLLDQIEQDYGRFSLNNPASSLNKEQFVQRQFHMVEWYFKRKQYVQCVATAKEWVTTLICVQYNADPTDYDERMDVEAAFRGSPYYTDISGARKESKYQQKWSQETSRLRKQVNKLLSGQQSKKEGGQNIDLNDLRNDLLHAGFSKNSIKAADVEARISLVVALLESIAVEAGVVSESKKDQTVAEID